MSRTKRITIRQRDSLRGIALRELGAPERWGEIAQLNDLALPFIIDSYKAEDRAPNTVIWGDSILIPWEGALGAEPTPISLYGRDVSVTNGRLSPGPSGDLDCVDGIANLIQALANRIKTPRGELVYHHRYGCHVMLALGMPARPFANMVASAWTYEALQEESRVESIQKVIAKTTGDVITVDANVTGVRDNTQIDFNLVLNP